MYVDGNAPSQFEFVVRKIHDLSDGNCDTLSISPTIAIPLLIVMAFDYGELFEKELKRKMSAFISLIKYAWCRMMARFWGKVADATKPKKRN